MDNQNSLDNPLPSVSCDPEDMELGLPKIDPSRNRFPYCVVWTPLPMLTWIIPFIGHMGICMSSGVIRDFAGPYFVSEDNMAFGNPTKFFYHAEKLHLKCKYLYCQRYPAVLEIEPKESHELTEQLGCFVSSASEEYKHRMHNLCCDNCHSHVAMALNMMGYDGSSSWNMVKLCFFMLIYGRYVGISGFLKTWLPFSIVLTIILLLVFLL